MTEMTETRKNTEKRKRYKGIACIILSAFCFGMMNIFVRLSGEIPTYEKSFFRNLVAAVFALLMMVRYRGKIRVRGRSWWELIVRSGFGTLGILCNFYAVDHMLVADASLLNKLSPFFVIIFSYFLLKEKARPFQILCVMVAFVGMLFIIKPGFVGMLPIPALIGTLGGMSAGIAYTFVRKLGQEGVPGPFIVLFFSSFSCLAMIPFMAVEYVPLSSRQVLLLLAAGLAAAGGQFGITAAYTYAPAREISIYDYSQIIFVTILSYFILGEMPDAYSFVGYVIIIGASLAMFLYNNRKTQNV